ncbi:MAG: Pup--protein ligase [Paeniglutamicibacter terrestris]|uniref:Pup--protein ligase n=1 Tax=Paeniglutamicibacter terrestris TaxID=2723403 RepID=A0ABX1G6K9_9MICC|nr:Pup--protein ligase [Paeniglutamicibacter terrestris]NKG21895.1 Pup--protein ligase [Paeniglutamicibacter terrestris]
MDRRIMGIETEYGINYSDPTGRPLTPEESARYLFRRVVAWGRSSNVFLTNGSRLYLDVGSHPEYATAECDGLRQLIAHDRAGESILNDLVASAEERMAADGFNGKLYLFKNNTDTAGNSYGCHENFLIPRKLEFARLAEILIPFLVTRQLIAGAGKIVNVEGVPLYSFSQRADHVWEGVSSATTRSRPIINTRDEPHADAEYFRRLHVIVGDSNMSETTQLLKLGATDLMLRIIESGKVMDDLRLENPIRSIREISHDFNGKTVIRLATGKQLTALELQRRFLALATDFVATEGAHHDQVPAVLDLWTRTLDAVESGNFSSIDTEIDWAIKHKLISAYANRHQLDLGAQRLAQLDLTYHDIDTRRGLFHLLAARGRAKAVVDQDDIDFAVDHPPQSTRAKMRGDFVRAAKNAERDFTVDWVHLKLNDHPGQTVLCKDPFANQDPRVDALISSLSGPV